MNDIRPVSTMEHRLAVVLFGVLLAFHAWGASVGWNNRNLPGCEFRQTQTAISALFILREDNYSLAYPTPVLGKPWSIPMEFPLYQWTVAKLTEVSGWTLTQSGRAVSLICFYLTLPALFLLLRRLGLPPARALVALGVVLVCPLYIFYARSFLIETMAWMFGSWFLLGYVRAVEQRSWPWLAVAVLGGVGAGLVKVTTFMAFLLPAFVWTLVWFWQGWREQPPATRWPALVHRVAWCAAAVAVPFAASIWWVRYSDAIKALTPAGAFLQSAGMSGYNFGVGVRFDAALWDQHWTVLFREIATKPVLIATALLAAIFARRWWALITLLVGFFFAVQVTFPILYAWHEYYYVAIAMLLMLAIGFVLCGVLESRAPRVVAWGIVLAVLGGQAWGYLSYHYPSQRQFSPGGSDLTVALKRVTEPDDVLVIAGNDWSSMIPYYAERRALMIRRNLEKTWDLILPAFDQLKDEPVGALIMYGEQRQNQALIDLAVQRFRLDPRPTFTWAEADIYLPLISRLGDLDTLAKLPGITPAPDAKAAEASLREREVDVTQLPPRQRFHFSRMHPDPWKFYTIFGLNPVKMDGVDYLWVHPVTRLWFKVPAGAHRLSAQINFLADAYGEKIAWGDRTDGIEIVAFATLADGARMQVGQRILDPRAREEDRGLQTIQFDFSVNQPADIEFAVLAGPSGSITRDWALLGEFKLE